MMKTLRVNIQDTSVRMQNKTERVMLKAGQRKQ